MLIRISMLYGETEGSDFMYFNKIQEYILSLLDEYGPLLHRQLLQMVNNEFNAKIPHLNNYIQQMCAYGDFEQTELGKDYIFSRKGIEPDFDVIRSFDVLIAFLPNVIQHRKSKGLVSIAFFTHSELNEKEVFVIPVKEGTENMVVSFANDKFGDAKCEIVIFLLEDKKQMKLINPSCNYRFAVYGKKGVSFMKANTKNN